MVVNGDLVGNVVFLIGTTVANVPKGLLATVLTTVVFLSGCLSMPPCAPSLVSSLIIGSKST